MHGHATTLEEAMVMSGSLLNPGSYGVSDDDPKVALIHDLGKIVGELGIRPVVIGGIAVIVNGYPRTTTDVDLLVARADALKLVRRLESTLGFSKIRIDRFKHVDSGRTVDLCIEGELTSPRHQDRFPSPTDVEQLPRDPLPVIGLIDLLALKAKSARSQDFADFVRLFGLCGLSAQDVERVKAKITDPALRSGVDAWHAAAIEDLEREKLRRPPKLE